VSSLSASGDTIQLAVSDFLLEDVENTFQIRATKSDPPQAGYELTLLPRAASMKRVFQKLDLRINDQLRVERTDMLLPNGDRIVTTYSNQTRGPVPASMFEFTPPAGTEVSTPLGQ
jgi:outer membrane lipoprotein-sorting protein